MCVWGGNNVAAGGGGEQSEERRQGEVEGAQPGTMLGNAGLMSHQRWSQQREDLGSRMTVACRANKYLTFTWNRDMATRPVPKP